MTIITYDAITDLKDALNNDWNLNKVNSAPKPDIQLIWDVKSTGYGSGTRPRILIQPSVEKIKPFDFFGANYWHDVPIKVDIRSYKGMEQHNDIVKTVSDIILNIIRRANNGFLQVLITGNESFNHEYRNMYRHVITLKYQDVNSHTFV